MSAPLARLEEIRETYTDRRTVSRGLLDEVIAWARAAEATTTESADAAATARDAAHRATVAQLQQRIDGLVDEVRAANESAAAGRRLVADTRTIDATGAVVTLTRPESGWTVEALEDATYRLRAAGGSDHTAVTVEEGALSASVPNPNLVHLGRTEHRSTGVLRARRRVRVPLRTIGATGFWALGIVALVATMLLNDAR